MKKTVLFLFLLITTLAQAQVIKVEPTTVTKSFPNENLSDATLQLQLYAKITNLTNQPISLKWTRMVVDQPLDWETQVCDNNACYVPLVSTNIDAAVGLNQPMVLAAGASHDIGLYVIPNGLAGKGTFQLIMAQASNPNTPIDTITFEVAVNLTTGINDISKGDIRVYPNPASDYFQLTNDSGIDNIVVYNLLGREVRSYRSIGQGQQYNLDGLPDGLYLVSLMDNRRGVLKTVRLNKRSFRP